MSAPLIQHPLPAATRWKFMSWTDIPNKTEPGRVYLRRLRLVQTPWFAFYLHFIYAPDTDRDPHDHPWPFWSFIVRGSYAEKVWPHPDEIVRFGQAHDVDATIHLSVHRRFSLHRMATTAAHMIYEADPRLVTFVFCGRRQRGWGFWTKEGFVPWQDYNAAVGLNPPLDEFA